MEQDTSQLESLLDLRNVYGLKLEVDKVLAEKVMPHFNWVNQYLAAPYSI